MLIRILLSRITWKVTKTRTQKRKQNELWNCLKCFWETKRAVFTHLLCLYQKSHLFDLWHVNNLCVNNCVMPAHFMKYSLYLWWGSVYIQKRLRSLSFFRIYLKITGLFFCSAFSHIILGFTKTQFPVSTKERAVCWWFCGWKWKQVLFVIWITYAKSHLFWSGPKIRINYYFYS